MHDPDKRQADLICELRAGAQELDGQHALNLAAGILHDAVNDGRTPADPRETTDEDDGLQAARIAAALGAARVAAYGTLENDPDWTGGQR